MIFSRFLVAYILVLFLESILSRIIIKESAGKHHRRHLHFAQESRKFREIFDSTPSNNIIHVYAMDRQESDMAHKKPQEESISPSSSSSESHSHPMPPVSLHSHSSSSEHASISSSSSSLSDEESESQALRGKTILILIKSLLLGLLFIPFTVQVVSYPIGIYAITSYYRPIIQAFLDENDPNTIQ